MAGYKDLSDKELIALLKKSDEQALSALYFRYWDKLFVKAAQNTVKPEDAEEILQDIFIRLWERRTELEITHNLSSYLAVAVKYKIIDYRAKAHRLNNKIAFASLDEATEASVLSTEDLLLEKELWQSIQQTIDKLPEKCRIVFKMSREEGRTNKQIGAELEISEKAVEAHISRALKGIRSNITTASAVLLMYLIESNK
ncbi:RNA polymerase sigma-70 factor [Taibaiella koreensis]|uniref:RNA polymerase sigma-70 factor n=1 Tax=Taibaiella koreensis TaxID=1268548 RepID=UPI000E59AC2A|nr:RNA polymerase sigma-70 factor [Taibaiella koreensis]